MEFTRLKPSDETGITCPLWKPISRWKEVSMIGWRVIQFPQQNGWTTGQWFCCLLSNYHNPSVLQEINRSVKGSKEKVKVSCPAVIREYNTYMGGVDLCDQMKVFYEVDLRSKVRFYVRVFFDFLDISVVNSKILYDKIQSTAAMSSKDFRLSLARSMIGTFSNRKRAISTSRPSKRSKGEIATVVDHLPQFAATRSRCAYCSLIKLENRTFIRCMKCHIPLCLQKE